MAVPSRLAPNGISHSTVFRAYRVVSASPLRCRREELLAEVTARPEDDVEPMIDDLWNSIEQEATCGEVRIVVYDGASGWSLPGLDRQLAG